MVNFAQLAEELGLGALLRQPERVSGGFMHRMYRLDTESGVFALKLLNREIMKRPEARENFRRAEMLERRLQAAGMPVVTALEYSGEKMQHGQGRDFYLFPWVEARALKPVEIQPGHCAAIGNLLAVQHGLQCDAQPAYCGMEFICWWELMQEAIRRQATEIAEMLGENLPLLEKMEKQRALAAARLKPQVCISNGDMDPKNVLWQDEKPLIIDLECLDYGHPEREMLMLALMWTGWETDGWKPENLRAFTSAYISQRGAPENDWATLYDSLDVWQEWLRYNAKRAVGLETQDEEERLLGLQQARFAMKRILFSEQIRQEVLQILEK